MLSIKLLMGRTKIAYSVSYSSLLKFDFFSTFGAMSLAIDSQLRLDAFTFLYRSIEA